MLHEKATNKLIFKLAISLIAFLLLVSKAQADFVDKQSVGLRYTDNAYLTPEDPAADFYFLLNSRFKLPYLDNSLRLKLDYAAYSKESDNDYAKANLGGRLSTFSSGLLKSSELYFDAFHKQYTNEGSATSDNSFTHTGSNFNLEREWLPGSSTSVTGGVSYENRFFHDFDGRSDHQLMLAADFDYFLNPSINPYAYGDIGVVLSSLPAYTQRFIDLGGGAKGPISPSLEWTADLHIRSASYMNRSVDQTSEITKRRGNSQTATTTENERTQSITVGGGLHWNLSREFDFDSRINITNQTSNNPNFEFKNNEIYFSLTYVGTKP